MPAPQYTMIDSGASEESSPPVMQPEMHGITNSIVKTANIYLFDVDIRNTG
jgi:predicted GTPase